jgi:hypothetical protein
MHLHLALHLKHFLLDLGALYALRPTFMKSILQAICAEQSIKNPILKNQVTLECEQFLNTVKG